MNSEDTNPMEDHQPEESNSLPRKKKSNPFVSIGSFFVRGFGALFRLLWNALLPKHFFHLDNIAAMLLVVGVLKLLGQFEFEFLNPIGDAFSDVEISDVLYSQNLKGEELRHNGKTIQTNEDIILVNCGNLNRAGIAELVHRIHYCEPKVLALDIEFIPPEINGIDADIALAGAFAQFAESKNLILVSKAFGYNEEKNEWDSLRTSLPLFSQFASNAFANTVREIEGGDDELNVWRNFITRSYIKKGDTTYNGLAAEVVRMYKPEKLDELWARNNSTELINFSGNIFTYDELMPNGYQKKLRPKQHFIAIDHTQLRNNDLMEMWKQLFQGKIVMLGFMGNTIDVDTGEDKFYTPLNDKYIGKANKDMYGVVVHANAIATILRGNYVNSMPVWLGHVIGVFLVWYTFSLFRFFYNDYKIWYDGITKLLGLLLTFVILFIIGIIFATYDYEIKFPPIYYGSILLAGDFLEIYYGFVKNLFLKLKRNI